MPNFVKGRWMMRKLRGSKSLAWPHCCGTRPRGSEHIHPLNPRLNPGSSEQCGNVWVLSSVSNSSCRSQLHIALTRTGIWLFQCYFHLHQLQLSSCVPCFLSTLELYMLNVLLGYASSQTRIALEKTIAIAPNFGRLSAPATGQKKRSMASDMMHDVIILKALQSAPWTTEQIFFSSNKLFSALNRLSRQFAMFSNLRRHMRCLVAFLGKSWETNVIASRYDKILKFQISDRPHFLPCQTPSTVTICTFCLVASILQPCLS